CSLYHETHNGWDSARIVARLRELAAEYAQRHSATLQRGHRPVGAKEIPIKIDDDGQGGAIGDLLRADGYRVASVGAGTVAAREDLYPNRRSERWFATADRARKGQLDLSRLPRREQARLKVQAMAPLWKPDSAGRRVVEKKDETKKRLNRSPDDMDALN